ARAVAEQDAGVAVLVVEDPAQHLGTDDEHVARRAGGDELRADLHAVEEPAARRRYVEPAGVHRADVRADPARGRRERLVAGHRAAQYEVDVLAGETGILQRGARGAHADGAARLVGRRNPAFRDAGALDDPLVRGIDHRLEVAVGEPSLRHVLADSGDADGLDLGHGGAWTQDAAAARAAVTM